MDQGTNPVNPYAPTGAPYAPGSNTPAPVFTPISPAPEKPKFFTKKFIIFTVIGLVLIIAAVVAGVIIQNNKKNVSNTSNTVYTIKKENSTTQANFNRYANWILNGTTSTDEAVTTDEPGKMKSYYIWKIFLDKEADLLEYLTTADNYNNTFSESISSDSVNEIFKNIITDNSSDIAFLKAYAEVKTISRGELLELYATSGKEQAKATALKQYEKVSQVKNYSAEEYVTAMNEYIELVLYYYDMLSSSSCIKNGALDNDCSAVFLAESDDARTIKVNISEKESEIENIVQNAVNTVIVNCWSLAKGVNNAAVGNING